MKPFEVPINDAVVDTSAGSAANKRKLWITVALVIGITLAAIAFH